VKPIVWRNAIRDSELDRTAKLVCFVISTYMNGAGEAFPAKDTIAKGAGLGSGRRSVDQAVDRIEAAGFLEVTRFRGRRSFNYRATLPNVASGATLNHARDATLEDAVNVASDDSQRRTNRQPTSQRVRSNVARAATESGSKASLKRAEGGARAPEGARASAPARQQTEDWTGSSKCSHKSCEGLERCQYEDGPTPPSWFPRKMPA
jgi:hypothetical protein